MNQSGFSENPSSYGPLHSLRVVDLSTVLAGPGCAKYFADYGADVIHVERTEYPDALREMGWRDPRDNQTFFWKYIGRNKRNVLADLKNPDDKEFIFHLIEKADVLIENFRPGKLEALGFHPDVLWKINPKLVITRVTGFGQDGPYAHRPGFATIAEAMSGFASINGETDGPPLLPPIALTDEITALAAAFATMVAIHSGVGQIVDVSLLDSMTQFLGPLVSAAAELGYDQKRLGSGIAYTVPRGIYKTRDLRFVAISSSSQSVAMRVMDCIGLGKDPKVATFSSRVDNREYIDEHLQKWVGDRNVDEVIETFENIHAAAARVYSISDLLQDGHAQSRELITTVDGVPMQNLLARLSKTPGNIRFAGKEVGSHDSEVRAEFV